LSNAKYVRHHCSYSLYVYNHSSSLSARTNIIITRTGFNKNLANFDTAIYNRSLDRRYIVYRYLLDIFQFTEFQFSQILFLFWYTLSTVSLNRKMNSNNAMDLMFLKKSSSMNAIIHVFTKTPPTQRQRKVVRFLKNALFCTEVKRRM